MNEIPSYCRNNPVALPHYPSSIEIVEDDVPPAKDWFWNIGVADCGIRDFSEMLNSHPEISFSLSAFVLGYAYILQQPEIDLVQGFPLRNDLLLKDWFGEKGWRSSTLRNIFEAMRSSIPKHPKIIGDGSCLYRLIMPYIQKIFPESKIIALSRRNVWDLFAAHIKHDYCVPSDENEMLKILKLVEKTVSSLSQIEKISESYPQQCLTLYLEDLVFEKEATVDMVCNFLGVEIFPKNVSLPFFREESLGVWRDYPELVNIKEKLSAGEVLPMISPESYIFLEKEVK